MIIATEKPKQEEIFLVELRKCTGFVRVIVNGVSVAEIAEGKKKPLLYIADTADEVVEGIYTFNRKLEIRKGWLYEE